MERRVSRVELVLFGTPLLLVDGGPVKLRSSRSAFALLGRVALGGAAGVGRDAACLDVWPELELSEARAELRRHLNYLGESLRRRGLDSIVERAGDRLRLRAGVVLDVAEFETGATPDSAADAVAYDAEFLATFEAPWIIAERARLKHLHRERLRARLDAVRSTDSAAALTFAERLCALDAFDEEALRALMELRAQRGDVTGALGAYARFEQRARSELGSDVAPQTVALRERIATRGAPSAKRYGFPLVATALVGREADLAGLAAAWRDQRIITCVGPPGIGKTRLAIRAAELATEALSLPASFIDVGAHGDADSIDAALAATFARAEGISVGGRTLAEIAVGRRWLVLLDNCEHAPASAREVARRAIGASPGITVLATSRVALEIDGELLWNVEPLEPGAAFELFLNRARLVRPALRIEGETRARIVEVCRMLDGVPLAIELAAAQLRSSSLQMIAAAGSARGGSLRATFERSVALLATDVRRLFLRLGMFRGGFTLGAAAAIDERDESSTLERLRKLVGHSLIRAPAVDDAIPRYAMLEPLREFAFAMTQERGEGAQLAVRHARYFADRYIAREELLDGERYHELSDEIERESDNLRAALDTLLGGVDADLGAHLLLALKQVWFTQGRVIEAERWAERALPLVSAPMRIRVLFLRALMSRDQNDRRESARRYAEIVALHEAAGNAKSAAEIRIHLAGCLALLGDDAGATAHARAALAVLEPDGHPDFIAYAHTALGIAAGKSGDLRRAEAEHRAALEIFERAASPLGIACELSNLATQAVRRGDHESASELARASIAQAEIARAPFIVAASLHVLARAAILAGDAAVARRHAADALPTAVQINDYEQLAELFEVAALIDVLEGEPAAAIRSAAVADGLRARSGAARAKPDEAYLASMLRSARKRLGTHRLAGIEAAARVMNGAGALTLLKSRLSAQNVVDIRVTGSSG
jgi:predicted ATPase/DNA-binding SARP family transcriptional activator